MKQLSALVLSSLLLTACAGTPTPDLEATVQAAVAATQTTQLAPSSALPTPTLGIGTTRLREKDGMVMVYVPAGEFTMGSSEADLLADDDEKPQHVVLLDAFWIDKTEVTNAQYRKCVEAGACQPSACADKPDYNADDQPVNCVDWEGAAAYAEWVGGRLPTEAEWEKAARGADRRIYPWGDKFDGSKLNGWSADDGYRFSAPVGSYATGASFYGGLDMAGNVWEWVADWYSQGYYEDSPDENPAGPRTGAMRVLRGGAFRSLQRSARCANRYGYFPVDWGSYIGFRVVMAPGSAP